MGQLQSSVKKQYQQIYTLTYEAYITQNHEQQQKVNSQLFEEIFQSFEQFRRKYQWAIMIPYYTQKYFSKILQSVRQKSIQNMYKALSVTIFSQNITQASDYESFFYLNIKNQNKPKEKKNSHETIRKSVVIQNQNLLNQQQSPSIKDNPHFRQSILFKKSTMPKAETNAIVMQQSLFIENLPQRAQQQLGLCVEVYKRFAMVIQSLMNSASFISLPLRHFELNMKIKRDKKKLQTRNDNMKLIKKKIVQQNSQGEQLRRIQKHNQKVLLDEISNFTIIYTDFVWTFYKLDKINQTLYSKLINYQNIYNLMTNAIWTRAQWVGERGWEYQQCLSELFLISSGPPKQSVEIPQKILELANNLSIIPIKYLKQIVLIYRQMSKLSKEMTADDLMLAYNRLFYQMAIRNKLRRVFRMIQIVNSLWEGEKFGQVGYAWITWQAGLEMILRQAQKHSLIELQQSVNRRDTTN